MTPPPNHHNDPPLPNPRNRRADAAGPALRNSRRHAATVLLAVALLLTGGACGGDGGPPLLSWYINPDDGGQAEIARRCTEAANGRYRLETSLLPNDASDQREQLVRRLAAQDSSVDLMSLDVVFVAEFAEAGFLKPIPEGARRALTERVVEPAVVGATWKETLMAAPMWANTQLLWYRKSVAREAGLDPSRSPVTWDEVIEAARQTNTTVGVQANRYEGYSTLINALVESAGGHIIENPGADAENLELGIDSPAGEQAATIIREIADSGVGGPALSTADEEATRALFQGPDGGFMVNWPYVWRAANAAVEDGSLDADVLADIDWVRFPRTTGDAESRPPLGGIDLGIGAWSEHPDLVIEALRCITSVENQTYYFLHEGNPPARAEIFDDPEVLEAFPMAPLIRESLQAAAPRPRTELYGDLSAALQRTFHPPDSLNESTPHAASEFISAVLRGERLV